MSIYWLLIRLRLMPKLLVYLSFIAGLGVSNLIIPTSKKGFFNQALVWLIPVLEISIVIVVVYSVIKSIIHYKRNNKNKENDFLKITKISLESKLGNSFFIVFSILITLEGILFHFLLQLWSEVAA